MNPKKNPISLRPHHGMCLAYFEGKGYSESFTTHMQKMLEQLTGTDSIAANDRCEKVLVRMMTHTDEICSACPNNEDGICRDEGKVRKFDRAVLAACGLTEEQVLGFDEFTFLVQAHILSAGRRAEICGGCQWESICANRKSRWESCCMADSEII